MNIKKLLLSILFVTANVEASTIEIVSPFGPGGPNSLVAKKIQETFKDSNYNITHKPGASSQVAIKHINKENSVLVFASIMTFVSIDKMTNEVKKIVRDDLEIIASIGILPNLLLCNSETGIKNYQDLKNYKGSLSFGSVGIGTSDHYLTQIMLNKLPFNNHIIVTYAAGGSKPIMDLLGNQINCMWVQYAVHNQHLSNPRVNAIMITNPVKEKIYLWEDEFKEKFPMTNIIGLAISKKVAKEVKDKITVDINTNFDLTFEREIERLGIIPFVQHGKNIKLVEQFNQETLKYLIKNKLINEKDL